jgi:hypothetical protein
MGRDLAINLVAAGIGAALAWLAAYLKRAWTARLAAGFLGLRRGDTCRFVIARYRDHPAASIRDVGALLEALVMIQRFQPVIEATDDNVAAPCGDVTEFCIGGPDSNQRSTVHLAKYLPGLRVGSVHDEDRLEISADGKRFKYARGQSEYAILAKILPQPKGKPLFLVCGQSAQANRGALYYLRTNLQGRLRKDFGVNQFCLVTLVPSPSIFGYKMAERAADITKEAFCDVIVTTT